MTSSYASTPETTNANRACRVVLGPCTDGLRDVLRHYVPPQTFPYVIKLKEPKLPRMTAVQRDLILPRNGSYTGIYYDMDISLLYILLRNITGISAHTKGWGNDPDPSDSSLAANIERIRLVRNRCVHSCDPYMSTRDFNSIWSTIRSVMVDLDAFLMSGNKYETEVDFLRSEPMDPERDLQYREELKRQAEEDQTTREIVANLESEMEELKNSPIPKHVRERYNKYVQKWREEDEFYYETHSFPSVMQKVIEQPYVTFVGVPGSGKSAMAHHIALKLQEEGYEVVPTKDVRKMEDYGDPRNPQVFVIDDVVGIFGLQKTKLDTLTDYEQNLTQPCMVKSRTLMTCREAVYNERLLCKSALTKEETVVKLHSFDHALNDKDKKQILQKYGLDVNLISPSLLTSTSQMFPLLCKLFSKETRFQALRSKFFINPAQCIIDELDDMQRHNELHYATLVLCMLNENRLSKDIIKDRKNEHFMNMKRETLENCRLEFYTDTFKFMDALSAMEGTYTKQCGTQYTFIHDSLFEICAHQYGKQFPEQMLLYMSSSYIANYVKPQTSELANILKVEQRRRGSQSVEGDESRNDSDGKEKKSDYQSIEDESSNDSREEENMTDDKNVREESFDLCIRLHEDQYPLLAERLCRDIQNMELYDVFRNPALKHPLVCQAFLDVLERKSYTELKSLFLSSQENIEKIVSKGKCVLEESKKKEEECDDRTDEWRDEWRRQRILMDERIIMDKDEIYPKYDVRVISWVIYYGHHQMLHYIINQIQQHREIGELFKTKENILHQSESVIYTRDKQGMENNRFVEEFRLLVLSCYSGDVQTVRVLLDSCTKTTIGIGKISEDIQCSWFHHSPLTAACNGGHACVVNELVKMGADVNLQDRWGNTPLIAACKGGHVSVVEELVKAKAKVNLQGTSVYGNTPLIAACERGHVRIVEELVKAGANVNLKNKQKITPMIATCKVGHASVVKMLVSAGADVNLQDGRGNIPLIAAFERGHENVVKELVKAGANINKKDRHGNTLLIAACEKGYLGVVEEIVKKKADVNQRNSNGNIPLIAACKRGHLNVVEELLNVGADVNLHDIHKNRQLIANTPLIAACEIGHMGVIKALLKASAHANLQDDDGNTPLIVACKKGFVTVVEELLNMGADVNLQDKLGSTPLITVCELGHVSVVEELVNAGADVNHRDKRGFTPLIAACAGGHVMLVEVLVKAKADIELHGKWGNTPLVAACKRGHVSVVEELVKTGADVNKKIYNRNMELVNPFSRIPFDLFTWKQKRLLTKLCSVYKNTPLKDNFEFDYESMMEELLKVEADVNLQDDVWYTPLTAACEGGHEIVVQELTKAGADVRLEDLWGNVPLITACKEGHVSVMGELRNAGADINQEDRQEITPLIAACAREHADVVEELVDAGADINPKDEAALLRLLYEQENVIGGKFNVTVGFQYIPLILACKQGNITLIEKLLKAGADVNFEDYWGNTPLIVACMRGHTQVVKVLVKAGANMDKRNRKGYTPLIAACERGHTDAVEELVNAGADVNPKYEETLRISTCEKGNFSSMEMFVKAGAEVNLQHGLRNTPLWAAYERGHMVVVEKLLKVKADVNLNYGKGDILIIAACKRGQMDLVKELLKAGADVNLQDGKKNTPLIAACEIEHMGIVEELLKAGADVNQGNKKAPLLLACKQGNFSLMEKLLKAGADVNVNDSQRNTPPTAACTKGYLNMAEEQLKAGVDVNLEYGRGYTPLIAACEKGRTDVVEELMKAGADINPKYDKTPLVLACEQGNFVLMAKLLKAGADINEEDRLGNTPMLIACAKGHLSVVKELLKAGADVNKRNKRGNSPVLAAYWRGHGSVLEELKKANADFFL